jgi:hypothetical protein
MFVKKPSVALKSILRSSTEAKASAPLPTDLSILRDETTGLMLITTPAEVVINISQIDSADLNPHSMLPAGATFPWLGHVRPTPTSCVPMISAQITLVIMREALRRTPIHKAARPGGVLGLILKHMPPPSHDALYLLLQTMTVTGITPPSWLKSHTILLYEKGGALRMDNYCPNKLADAM